MVGQLICYFVIDLRKRDKNIRKFISVIEKLLSIHLNILKLRPMQIKKILEYGIKIKIQK